MTVLHIKGAHIVDPASGRDEIGDIVIEDRKIAAVGAVQAPSSAKRLDAGGLVAAPAFIDAGVFRADAEACLAGGITRILLMPDQSPALDDPALIERAMRIGKPHVWVHPLAAATRWLAGTELGEIGLMQAAGAAGVSTGRRQIASSAVMHRLLRYSRAFGMTVMSHAEDLELAGSASATDGETATRMGLPSAPAIAESVAVSRDIRLAEDTGAALHIRTVSTAGAIDIVRRAKSRGVRVTCGTTPAHLLLNDAEATGYRSFARLSPPLRSEADRLATVAAVQDGTIDVICSGHDPRTQEEKRLPYAYASPGMAGLETLFSLSLMALGEEAGLSALVARLSAAPARIFGLPGGKLDVGAPADVALFDPKRAWRVEASALSHAAANTPFDRLPVRGRVVTTIKGGEIVYNAS
ncbi:dihydroorotase [Pacificimonas sp. WHA3]|uniref:Dihydroorotase n=1 Tax=Pacificimonas pallii TaxID=2827236 RepID=A0ABS6SEN3_9SPHN|nr:dihydroorotase [Pacificimonas pallii]MBV7256406.1 dihydroorotase [Pacificimonas pallii]